jgi:GntR family transcriptional regulator
LQAGPVTLYAQVASILRDRIVSGTWKHEQEIPTLDELAKQFSVARVTVRQAVQMLSAEGLLSSQRGRRTYVTLKVRGQDQDPLFSSTGSIDITNRNYTIDVLSREKVTVLPPRQIAFGNAVGEYWRIRKLDSENGTPYALSDNYVAAAVYKRIPRDAERKAKVSRLVRDYAVPPIKRAYEVIRVAVLSYDEATLLRAPLSSPVALIDRVFLSPKDEITYFGSFIYRGNRFSIERDISEFVRR